MNPSALSEETTQTDYLNTDALVILQRNSNGTLKKDEALGFATAQELYLNCIHAYRSDYSKFLDNAKSPIIEIEENLKTLTNNLETSKAIDKELQESIKSDFKMLSKANKQVHTLVNLICHEAIILYRLSKDLEQKDNVIIEKYISQLMPILLNKKIQHKMELNNLQSQIEQIRKQLDPLRNKAKSLRQNTAKQEKRLLITKEEYESTEREVEHAQETFNKADQAAKASFNPNLKDQIDQ